MTSTHSHTCSSSSSSSISHVVLVAFSLWFLSPFFLSTGRPSKLEQFASFLLPFSFFPRNCLSLFFVWPLQDEGSGGGAVRHLVMVSLIALEKKNKNCRQKYFQSVSTRNHPNSRNCRTTRWTCIFVSTGTTLV